MWISIKEEEKLFVQKPEYKSQFEPHQHFQESQSTLKCKENTRHDFILNINEKNALHI